MKDSRNSSSVRQGIRLWFRPPRAHGEVIDDRTVSFLELFYDLVFVVLIAQVAHTLAGHLTWTGLRDFVIVFSLIWMAWLNGTLYHELHGGEDGRSRMYIFGQMGLLSLLSVYAGHALDDPADGRGFAIVYAILFALLAWQWFDVSRVDTAEMRKVARPYVILFIPIVLLVAASAALGIDARRAIWVAVIALFFASGAAGMLRRNETVNDAMHVTESMAERFGLFTIIVLGEVVVGVVEGLGESERTARTVVTGLIALGIGYSIWWTYFDFVGRKQPKQDPTSRTIWTMSHFPLTLSIAATGAGMVSLIEHAGDLRTPANTAWLLAGGTAGVALTIAMLAWAVPSVSAQRMVPRMLVVAAVVAVVAGATRPAPWLLALILYLALSSVWMEAFIRHARQGTLIAEG